MAQIEKLMKSLETLKLSQSPQLKPTEKTLVPLRYLKQENILNKRDYIYHCDTIADIVCSSAIRNSSNFSRLLSTSIETFFILCNNNDADIRNAANEGVNKLISNLVESHSNRILLEFYKEISKNSYNRSLRVALVKFSEVCHLIRPSKYRAYAENIFSCIVKIINCSDDELLQDVLQQSVSKIYQVLAVYASEKEITNILTAYLANLSSQSLITRRSAALSIAILCANTKKSQQFFLWTLNKLLNILNSNLDENDKLISGSFMVAKFLFPKISNYIEINSQQDDQNETIELIIKNLFYVYQHLLTTIRCSSENIVIMSALEALVEFFNFLPFKLYHIISNLKDNKADLNQFLSQNTSSDALNLLEKRCSSGSNLSISSSINYIENISDDDCNEVFKKSGITFFDNRSIDTKIGRFSSDYGDTECDLNYDTNSEFFNDNSLTENKTADFEFISDTSSIKTSPKSLFSSVLDHNNDSLDLNNFNRDSIDFMQLGELFSIEYACKLICLKFLLKGEKNQLIPDDQVRVSIKSLALSCISSIIHICPQVLFSEIRHSDCQFSQLLSDILLYSSHSDPNIKGHVSLILAKFFENLLSLPISYNEFLSHNNLHKNNISTLNNLLPILYQSIHDSSSIVVKQALIAFQLFLPKLLKSSEFNCTDILNLIENMISLRNNSYWLVKIELVKLFANISYNSLKYLEQKRNSYLNLNDRPNFRQKTQSSSISRLIVEEIVFVFIFDDDHRVRLATLNLLNNFIENLTPSSYICNDGLVNLVAFESILSNFRFVHKTKMFDSLFPDMNSVLSPLEYNLYLNSLFSLNTLHESSPNLKHFNRASNILLFVNRFYYEICHNFQRKSSLVGSIAALKVLADHYPPDSYPEGWSIVFNSGSINDKSHKCIEMVSFFIDLLVKNQTILFELTAHQNLIYLIVNLLETIVSSYIKYLSSVNGKLKIVSEIDFLNQISPCFIKSIEQYFIHLMTIIVAYCSISEDNSAIFVTFVHNMHSKNMVFNASTMKKRNGKQFDTKEKDKNNFKKELSNKGSKKQESYAFSPFYHKLFDFLKSYHRMKKNSSSTSKSDKNSLLNAALNSMSKLLEVVNSSFIYNYLDDLLLYLKIVFVLDPTSTIRLVKQLLRCCFGVNYLSLFVQNYNDNINLYPNQISQVYSSTNCLFKINDLNSLYNSCSTIPYIKFNEFFNNCRTKRDHVEPMFDTYLSWYRKQVNHKMLTTMNPDGKNRIGFDSKKFLTAKIRVFEPLVVKTLNYVLTSDKSFQAEALDLLAQLVQLHVNYCMLDMDNIFIDFIFKQYELLENVQNSKSVGHLMRHMFYFLAVLSHEHYVSSDVVDIPKLIQLCDGLIANGHQQLAIDGLYIIVDDIYYYRDESNVESFTDLEAQREVVLAYCFKLLDFEQTFDLLALIVNFYKKSNRLKWINLSIKIVDILISKLMQNVIKFSTIRSFECFQSLLYSLFSTAICGSINLFKCLFAKHPQDFKPFYKILIFLKLVLINFNEEDLLNNVELICNTAEIDLDKCSEVIDINTETTFPETDDKMLNGELIFARFLLNKLEFIVSELFNDLMDYNLKTSNSEILLNLVSDYILTLTFIFQSGFFPKITNSAISCMRNCSNKKEDPILKNVDVFNFIQTNNLFLKLSKFYPTLTISWLNLLYVLNYENLSQTLSKCIENSTMLENSKISVTFVDINSEIVKRYSLILLCDFLSENLEKVEYLSWLIINHLKEIVDHCSEMPIKEFINAIHRKSSSSGLFLQAINSRCIDNLSNPIFALNILSCLERAHSSQTLPLIMLLLEKFLFNEQLACYYKCRKYAEIIVSNRLSTIYEFNNNSLLDKSFRNPLSQNDINNLISLLKNTPYTKLNYTLHLIRKRYFKPLTSKSFSKIIDPLSEDRIKMIPEINKQWYINILNNQLMLPYQTLAPLLNKLTNEDLILLLTSKKFPIENLCHVIAFLVDKCHEQNVSIHKLKLLSDFNRLELIKLVLPIYKQYLEIILEQFPLKHYLKNHESVQISDLCQIFECDNFMNSSSALITCFGLLIGNLALLEKQANFYEISKTNLDINLLIVYSTCIYNAHSTNNFAELINLLRLIKCSLNNRTLFDKLSKPEYINFQSILINTVYFIFNNYYVCSEEIFLPHQLAYNNEESIRLKNIFNDCFKMVRMFHHSVECKSDRLNIKGHVPRMLYTSINDVVLLLSNLPFINSLLFMPFEFFKTKDNNVWNGVRFSGKFYTKIPIISPFFLGDIKIFKQFLVRLTRLGFSNRIQFEEIWMTLLGVFSENLSTLNQATLTEDIDECITLCKLVIEAITLLLYNAHMKQSNFNSFETSSKRLKHSFGAKFENLRENIKTRLDQIECNCRRNNRKLFIFNFDYIPLARLKENIRSTTIKSEELLESNESTQNCDLYSCIHFLIDHYLQTVKSYTNRNSLYFPILSSIAKSCVVISDLFVEKVQYEKTFEIWIDLSKIVENYDDEILNHDVIVGLSKSYSVMEITGDNVEKLKNLIIEQNSKDFYICTRLGSMKSIRYLVESKNISNKDLAPIMNLVSKHLNSDIVFYCREYHDELWNFSLFLIDNYGQLSSVNVFFEEIIKSLTNAMSNGNIFKDFRIIHNVLEQLIFSSKINIKEGNAINNLALNQIKISTNQLSTIYLLNLIICTFYLVGPNFNFDIQKSHNDELFETMEKLSVIFDPLKSCNSLEANSICHILGTFLTDFFPAQDLLNKCIGEFLSNQQNHCKYLTNILFSIFNKFQSDFHHNDTAQDWVILSLSSFTQLIPISHALWALTCFLISASQNHWVRASYPYFQNRFGQFEERDKLLFYAICHNFYNEIKSDENKLSFIKTFQKAACLPNSPYFEVLKYLCDT